MPLKVIQELLLITEKDLDPTDGATIGDDPDDIFHKLQRTDLDREHQGELPVGGFLRFTTQLAAEHAIQYLKDLGIEARLKYYAEGPKHLRSRNDGDYIVLVHASEDMVRELQKKFGDMYYGHENEEMDDSDQHDSDRHSQYPTLASCDRCGCELPSFSQSLCADCLADSQYESYEMEEYTCTCDCDCDCCELVRSAKNGELEDCDDCDCDDCDDMELDMDVDDCDCDCCHYISQLSSDLEDCEDDKSESEYEEDEGISIQHDEMADALYSEFKDYMADLWHKKFKQQYPEFDNFWEVEKGRRFVDFARIMQSEIKQKLTVMSKMV